MNLRQSKELQTLLDEKYFQFNRAEFIEDDPIQIPHLFTKKEDIEIAGFLTATIAWGNRKAIVQSAKKWMQMLDYAPYDFVLNATDAEYDFLSKFYYRTFNGIDTVYFLKALARIYREHGGLEAVSTKGYQHGGVKQALTELHQVFFSYDYPSRTLKHLANVASGSSGKRLNMFLRWMVRNDGKGVDFGLWDSISVADLYLPLDVHTGRIARLLGLLQRKSNDWKAVDEVTQNLRAFDPHDPVKYDFALFGMGVEGYFDTK